MRRLQYLSFALAAVLLAFVTSSAAAQAASFDGYWVISLTPDSSSEQKGAYAFKEQMLIEGGSVTAELFSNYGFAPKSASLLATTPQVKFEAVMAADKFGSLKWTVTVVSSTQTTGTLVWTRNDGVVWNYTFIANKGTPPAPAE
jgi:hypothetical protein